MSPTNIPQGSVKDQTAAITRTPKAKCWQFLMIGGAVCLIPYVGMAMWLLGVPLLAYTAFGGWKLIRSGDKEGGALMMVTSMFVAPFAFLFLPFISVGVVETISGASKSETVPQPPHHESPAVSQDTIQAGNPPSPSPASLRPEAVPPISDSTSASEAKTREAWAKLAGLVNAYHEVTMTSMQEMVQGNLHLTDQGIIALSLQTFWGIGQMKTAGVDPELVQFLQALSAEGTEVFQYYGKMLQFAKSVGTNFTGEQAIAFQTDLKQVFARVANMEQKMQAMQQTLTATYGPGFEEIARGTAHPSP